MRSTALGRVRRRVGVTAIPAYLIAVGAGHIWLAMRLYAQTEGLARDGQAFSGTAVLGAGFVVLGVVATPVALAFERGLGALLRGTLAGLSVAAAVVGYTAARTALEGYVTAGVPGQLQCIVEQGHEICPPGDGTWIAESRVDPVIVLAACAVAYVIAHIAARLRPVPT